LSILISPPLLAVFSPFCRLAGLQNTLTPTIDEAVLLIFAGDHGFTKSTPGVSAYPREVSTAVFNSIASGGAASAVLCKANDCRLILADVGLDRDVDLYSTIAADDKNAHVEVVKLPKKKRGSDDFLSGPAMSKDDVQNAMHSGNCIINQILQDPRTHNKKLAIGIGELGIGNTTSAAAILCAVTGKSAEQVCGRGTGIDDTGLALKISTVNAALEKNKELINTRDPLKILAAVGGLEIASMVGGYITAADHVGIALIVDGFISGTAALVACMINKKVANCLFWSHSSAERGATLVMQAVNNVVEENDGTSNLNGVVVVPILDLGLRLGEGTGAVLALPLLRSAAAVMTHMAALNDIL
jgi:nicotinate-nucleotide--dimethylbenzimidazole phosphoribosyltransferase